MKISRTMGRKRFAAAVVKALQADGISCVLVGGACVSIYTNEKHRSHDLDFISPYSHDLISAALGKVGFVRSGRYFTHPGTQFYVEFPSGPPAIGNQAPVEPEGRLKVGDTVISLYSPTQCVMDRLAAWYHWRDRKSLIHAVWVAQRHPIQIAKVKKWSIQEGELEKFEEFLELLSTR